MMNMDKVSIFSRLVCAAAVLMLTVQSCDVVDGYMHGSEAVTWCETHEKVVSSAGATFDFSFTAREAWSVSSDTPSMLAITSADRGPKGRATIRITASKNTAGGERRGTITIRVEGYEPEVLLTVTQRDMANDDYDVNVQKTDVYLSQMYLWNDEYNALTRDFDQPYDEFVDNTLFGMKTNGEDGSLDKDGKRKHLYSYIVRTPRSRATRSIIDKVSAPTFGIISFTAVALVGEDGQRTGDYLICLHGVYPDSPAARIGLTRGSCIISVDGQRVTADNVNELFARLVVAPTAGDSMTVKFAPDFNDYYDNKTRTMKLTAESQPSNPVLYSNVFERSGHKIGYLVYGDFEASFDDELLAEIRKFQAAGIDELVLDLRVNGGGHVISSQMLASVIAGAQGDGKACFKQEYNADRMAAYGYSFPDRMDVTDFGPDAMPAGTMSVYSRSDYLTLNRVFVLVSGSTASASELTFTALRGIDFPVTLIGARTEGKNVGMEPSLFTYGNYDYEFYPITFRTYNAKNQTADPNGTKPDYEVNDWEGGGNAYWPWGSEHDPLLTKAVSLITGSRAAEIPTRTFGGRGSAEVLREMHRPGRGTIDTREKGEVAEN